MTDRCARDSVSGGWHWQNVEILNNIKILITKYQAFAGLCVVLPFVIPPKIPKFLSLDGRGESEGDKFPLTLTLSHRGREDFHASW